MPSPDSPGPPFATPDLTGRSVLVTGAGVGIGRATARLCAQRGARVCAVDVSPEVMTLPEEVSDAASMRIETRLTDLADAAAVGRLAREIETRASSDIIDALVNCAAAYPPGGILDSRDADWTRVLQVNVVAAATLCRAMARRFIEVRAAACGGSAGDNCRTAAIVNVGSVQEALPPPTTPRT